MTLNKQLLLVSLLLLSLPWAGYQYLLDMSESLRERQVSILENNSRLIARAISQSPELAQRQQHQNRSGQKPIYCHEARRPIRADGYIVDYEWTNRLGDPLPWDIASGPKQTQTLYRCSKYNDQLQLIFKVNDPQVVFSNPSLSSPFNGDRVILQTGQGINYVFSTAAAGGLTPVRVDAQGFRNESNITASWVDLPTGYQIEVSLPVRLVGDQMSFIVVDQQVTQGLSAATYGPGLNTPSSQIPRYLFASAELKNLLSPFANNGLRVKLLTPQGWLLASAGKLDNRLPSDDTHWLLKALYQRLQQQADIAITNFVSQVNLLERREVAAIAQSNWSTASQWYAPQYRDPEQLIKATDFILASAAAVYNADSEFVGIVVLEQSSQHTTSLTDAAFNRFFLTSAATLVLVILVLMGYASWLSWRIRKLSTATRNALESKSTLGEHFPTSHRKDEIGELSRDFAKLIHRVDDYTLYLRDLSSKLSHELRTPLAIIHSSLDNLQNQPLPDQAKVYQQRAKEGASRLGTLITAMSEARRVEESLEHAEAETLDICQFLRDLSGAYQDLYQPQHVQLHGVSAETPPYLVTAIPDLLVQMMDKLMENAHSFCPQHGTIRLSLSYNEASYSLCVSNDGPLLPSHMQHQLFDNLVSLRRENDEQHLGMGLHIVKLIATYHQGEVECANLADKSGVAFHIRLPKQPSWPH